MKSIITKFCKVMILVIGLVILFGLIWFPQTEGRATNLNIFDIYSDPFILYIYLSSLILFFGMYQLWIIVDLIDAKKTYSMHSLLTLRKIRIASLSIVFLIVVALVYIRFLVVGEDSAGPTTLGILLASIFMVTSKIINRFEKIVQKKLSQI